MALPSPQCHPAVVNTMKPRIKQVKSKCLSNVNLHHLMCPTTPLQICKALEAIWEFSDVMENYLDEKGKFLLLIHSKFFEIVH